MIYALQTSLTLTICLFLFCIPVDGRAQQLDDGVHSDSVYIEVAREIMTQAGTCALITLDAEGRPRVRTMDPFRPEDDLTVWFATNPKSRKVEQIRSNPSVTLYYVPGTADGYVMLHGSASLVDSQKEKANRWKERWTEFYPDYPEGYLLIKFRPEWMEIVSYAHGMVGDSITWLPPTVNLDQKSE